MRPVTRLRQPLPSLMILMFLLDLVDLLSRIWQSFDVIFCRICTSSAVCCFRAPSVAILTSLRRSGKSTAWVLPWKTRSRPIGVRVCPVAQFNFFGTAFDPRAWTLVVFWKEDLGRQHQLIALENEEGYQTSSPSPPRFNFFDGPDIPLGAPGLPPGWPPTLSPPAPPPAGKGERVRTGNSSRERSRPRSPYQSLNVHQFR